MVKFRQEYIPLSELFWGTPNIILFIMILN
jgi:hypothetical protein